MKRLAFAAALWACASSPTLAQDVVDEPVLLDPSRDWAQTLRDDARAIHATLVDSHPGVHDTLNPEFRPLLDQGLARALERADTTRDIGGWWWGLREFIATFNDGHVGIFLKSDYDFSPSWPGFLTRFTAEDQIVAARDGTDDALPPVGAKLLDCDGTDAARLAQTNIAPFRGRWFLNAMRVRVGDVLFVDNQNPWIKRPEVCRFETGGQARTYNLRWREGGTALRAAQDTLRPKQDTIGVEALADGGFWISTPTFDGNPEGPKYPLLRGVIETMNARQSDLRNAPYIVFDLRGNTGGSSNWSRQMAQALWGDEWISVHKPKPSEGVDWRVSEANYNAMAEFGEQLRATGANPEVLRYIDIMTAGMKKAMEANQIFWREDLGQTEAPEAAVSDPELVVKARVFALTDAQCASACLDALDTWKAAGAIQIGRETSADTVYMDVRVAELPSGLAQMAVPMKVYRGRSRGNNEPHMPTHVLPVETLSESDLRAVVGRMATR
ncbi:MULTISPECIES: S41 family peptidase [unclassified Brevundimonas]|uniref:S41 family peptidase n=1 Tax=unclassified Brevundimonas TaxID=2622653 RepID=UPI0025BF37D7|nr:MULTISPECIES: S41 family peptidase [unclassified Brevundimonas]